MSGDFGTEFLLSRTLTPQEGAECAGGGAAAAFSKVHCRTIIST